MNDEIVIIDGCGANLASLRFALQRLGGNAVVSSDRKRIEDARHVILPGVGAAGFAMAQLRLRKLDTLIPELRQPVLGICLGMQLLLQASDEGDAACLGVIPGRCERFVPAAELPTPHMGWNRVYARSCNGLFADIDEGAHFYFVHSYAAPVGAHTAAWSEYGHRFSAALSHNNFFGAQFHPERSGKAGARLLANFLSF